MHIIQEKWSDILNMIKIEHDVSDVSFNAWLEPLEVYKVEGNVVTIIVTNGSMALDYINKKYLLPLKVSIAETIGQDFVRPVQPVIWLRLNPNLFKAGFFIINSIYVAEHPVVHTAKCIMVQAHTEWHSIDL